MIATSALAHRQPLQAPNGVAALAEKPHEGKLILRGQTATIGGAVQGVLGVPLPAQVFGTHSSSRGTVQWLSPDEWLIITAPGAEAALAADLGKALAGWHAQVVDVSDYYTSIVLSGVKARAMLMKVATIDFHPKAFKVGQGVSLLLGRANPWLRQTRDDAEPGGPAFDIIIRISMADYLWCLLAEAGHEWGLPLLEPKGSKVKLHLPHFEDRAGE
jgi:sarcosine oxidase subunit gamma